MAAQGLERKLGEEQAKLDGLGPQKGHNGLMVTGGRQPAPGFPVELGGVVALHASFFTERRTRGSVQCSVAGKPASRGRT
jgi:hypothetical protein